MCQHETFTNNCSDCYQIFGRVHAWNYSRDIQFSAKSHTKRYFGIELEFEIEDGLTHPRDVLAGIRYHRTSHWHAMEDGSLYYGIEFVSQPFTRMQILTDGKFLNWLKKLPKEVSCEDDVCGMHVHVNRDSFENNYDISKINYFVNSQRPHMENIGGRRNGQFRYFQYPLFRNWEDGRDNRYKAVNLTNNHTIEFRFMKATRKPAEIKALIGFIEGMCEIIPTMTKDELRDHYTAWETFLKKLVTHKRSRHNSYLINMLKKKGFWSDELNQLHKEACS